MIARAVLPPDFSGVSLGFPYERTQGGLLRSPVGSISGESLINAHGPAGLWTECVSLAHPATAREWRVHTGLCAF